MSVPRPNSSSGRRIEKDLPRVGPEVAARRVTLTDVARAVGVGTTTVSDILLRGKTNYRAEMVEKVRAGAARLGYRPSALARGMSRGRTETVGVVLTVPSLNPFFAEFLHRLQRRIDAGGHMTLLSVSEEDPATDLRALRYFESQMVDAVVMGPIYTRAGVERRHGELRMRGPFISFLSEDSTPGDAVNLSGDHAGIGRLAVRRLLEAGHRRVAYVCCPPEPRKDVGTQVFRGYHEVLSAAGLFREEDVWVTPVADADQARAVVTERLAAGTRADVPTALFCHNDLSAIGAAGALRAAGYAVPRDMSVVGVDNIPLAAHAVPPLTTVDLHAVAMADAVADLLWRRLAEAASDWRRIEIAPSLVERASVAAPRRAS